MKSKMLALMSAITLVAALAIPARYARGQQQADGAANTANPVPLINQPLAPDAIKPGSAGFTLTVNGTGFVSGAVVHWNGSPRTTTFVSGSKLTASILASDIVKPHTASVTVVNPAPGGTSNVALLDVTTPTSSIGLSAPKGFAVGAYPLSVAMADFNGDGKLDLAVANSNGNSVSVLLGNGDGTFQAAVYYGTGSAVSVAVGDFNGDGKLDLAVANFAGCNCVSVLLGNGDGTFQAAGDYPAGLGPVSVALADFNGDGKLDLAVAASENYVGAANNFASPGFNDVSILLGNGDGTFQTAVGYPVGSSPQSVAVGDFNGDGRLDLAVANSGSNNVGVLLGNGDGTFQVMTTYAVGTSPISVAAGDFNGDGKLDLAVANSNSNSVSVLLGNGEGTFQAAVDYPVGLGPTSVAVGDLNGDGKLDLAVANSSYYSNNVSVLLGNGNGTFQPAVNYGTGTGPDSVAVGDFNGDGRIDMAVVTQATGVLDVLLQGTVSLSKKSMQFAAQVGNSSAAQAVTLTNLGPLALSIGSIAVTGTNAGDFSQTDTCGSSVPPGGHCTITVTFTPTQLGPRTASVTITDNAPDSQQSVALTGNGLVTLSPTSLTFATTQVVGTTSPAQSATLSNYRAVALGITTIGFTGADPGDFHQTNNCGSSVASGASCTINITFKPTLRGSRTAALSITDNAPGSPQTVSLSGTGTVVELNPSSLYFQCSIYNSCPTQTTTLTNTGNTPLTIGITVATNGTGRYFFENNNCPPTLGGNQFCTIWVRCGPPAPHGIPFIGYGTLSVNDNGGGSPQRVSLSCFRPGGF